MPGSRIQKGCDCGSGSFMRRAAAGSGQAEGKKRGPNDHLNGGYI